MHRLLTDENRQSENRSKARQMPTRYKERRLARRASSQQVLACAAWREEWEWTDYFSGPGLIRSFTVKPRFCSSAFSRGDASPERATSTPLLPDCLASSSICATKSAARTVHAA